MCPTVYYPVHISSLANVHRNESLIGIEVSVFCDTINTGSLSVILLVILLLPHVIEILKLWISRTDLFTDDVDFRWANIKSWIWAWVVAELVSLQALPYTHQGKLSDTTFSYDTQCCHLEETESVFLLSCPQGWLTCIKPPEQTPLCCPDEPWGPVSQVLQQIRAGPSLWLSYPWGWLTFTFAIKASSIVLHRQGIGISLPSATAREGQG